MTTQPSVEKRVCDSAPGPRNRTLAIFLISVLGLFLELMLIRWITTEIRIFAYLQNTVLIVCFLGLGMGCFTCRKPVVMRRVLLGVLLLAALLATPLTHKMAARITDLLSVLNDLLIWQHAVGKGSLANVLDVLQGLTLTFLLMVVLWEIFVPIGRLLGRLLDDHPRTIWAYSVNVLGSLIGIWLFVGLSALSAPPIIWMLLLAGMLVWFLDTHRQRVVNFGLLGALLLAGLLVGRDPGSLETLWSPYQKLVLRDHNTVNSAFAGKCILVNNTGYQTMIDLGVDSVAKNPQIPADMRGLSQYDVPLRIKSEPNRVLIVGAGSGNDVAGALRGGAGHVTAVEIDPVIIEMGRRHHPERPYDSPRVTVVNDDARSFFANTDQEFDLIIFGLLDSHTTTAMTNARLDHYVYTEESLSRARSLLTDDGVMALSFEAAKPYIADRMGVCLKNVFQQNPLAFRIPLSSSGWGGAMFIVGDQDVIQGSLAHDNRLVRKIKEWQAANPIELKHETRLATDDWPYIYLKSARIPTLYYLFAALMVGLFLYGKRRLGLDSIMNGWGRSHWHFFFMGAAFLLLEVQNISKASVALGNTWIVNAVIISGILLMILLANVIAARLPRLPQKVVGGLLVGCCTALYFVDLSQFAFMPFAAKALIVGGLTTFPMLFAGVIFINSFAQVERKDRALGANLLGSLVGGVLQSITFITGIKALLLLVALLYLAALATRPRADLQPTHLDPEEGPRDAEDDVRDAALAEELELLEV